MSVSLGSAAMHLLAWPTSFKYPLLSNTVARKVWLTKNKLSVCRKAEKVEKKKKMGELSKQLCDNAVEQRELRNKIFTRGYLSVYKNVYFKSIHFLLAQV